MKEVVIIEAIRTPIGKYKGSLSEFSAAELGVKVSKEILHKTKIGGEQIDQVIFGNVLQAGSGQNVARQISLNSGIPETTPAMTINEVCGSGMKAVILARQLIQLGEAEIVLAGGTESMSQAPLLQMYEKETDSYGEPISSMINDGLTDAFSNTHMGLTAEKVAQIFSVTREEQDEFALQSQLKAASASEKGKFKEEILPIQTKETLVDTDEGIRGNSTLEKLSTLRTVFAENGTVTAGNASTLNDGASVLLLTSKEYAEKNGLSYLAVIKETAEIGIDPSIMGVAPINAINHLLEKARVSFSDIDLFEINEAFAASSIAVNRTLGLDEQKVNIYGGGISLGHPIGASGARILTTLGYALKREKKKYGIASLCIGGGMGLAMLLEAPRRSSQDATQKKFYQLTPSERRQQLAQEGKITTEQEQMLAQQTLTEEVANHLIENQISEIELPLGVAQHFVINGHSRIIPMATEEPSVIAAAGNGAKICGEITVHTPQRLMRGQIVFSGENEYHEVIEAVEDRKEQLFAVAQKSYPSIVKRGGGVREILTREFTGSDQAYLTIDFLVDVQDAMGANIINFILEGVAEEIRSWFPNKTILFSILSNFATESLATASCEIPFERLGKNVAEGSAIAEKIQHAAEYAKLDPYRAATHNKGIMNGVDAVVLATGNDHRAVAAAIHAYAARNGRYEGLTNWRIREEKLVGELTLPLAVAVVGGALKVLPKAQIALEMLKVKSAEELAQIIAAVGLAQNLAAVRALVTSGIQSGHMALQARSLAITVGAIGPEITEVAEKLKKAGQMNQATATQILKELRK